MQVRQLILDVDNLDATIRMFNPDIDLTEVRLRPVPPRHVAFHGEVSRLILATLRETAMPLTTNDITRRVMGERGLNLADPRLFRTVQNRVGSSLRAMRLRGRVVSRQGAGQNVLWGLVGA